MRNQGRVLFLQQMPDALFQRVLLRHLEWRRGARPGLRGRAHAAYRAVVFESLDRYDVVHGRSLVIDVRVTKKSGPVASARLYRDASHESVQTLALQVILVIALEVDHAVF